MNVEIISNNKKLRYRIMIYAVEEIGRKKLKLKLTFPSPSISNNL